VETIYEHLDFHNGVQAFMSGIQIASMSAMGKGILEFGPPNTTVLIFEDLMDSKALWLTPNTTSVYNAAWLELGDEPMVIETPPDVLGIIDDHWFKYVADFGRLGPDKSKGGKFLILPPGYDGDVPEGYFVYPTNTYGNWVIWRGFQVDGSTRPAVDATKKNFRMYPLSRKDNPPKMKFINVSGKFNNTIRHRAEPRDPGFPGGNWNQEGAAIQAGRPDDKNPLGGSRRRFRNSSHDHSSAAQRRVLFVPG
jgi:hypothetical protein